MTRLHAIYLDLKSGQCIWSSRRRHICKLHKNSRLNTYNALVHVQCTGSRWYERWPRSKSSVGGELGGVRCGNREQFTPTPLTAAAACWPAGASSKPSPGISHWLDLDETSCLVLVTLSSNPGLSSRPASHWQAPQHRESRGRSSPPLLPPLLQPSRPRSASRSPPPEDDLDHWVRIRQAPASSPRWTTSHRWSTVGWTGCRWGRGSCTWSNSSYSLVKQPKHAPNDCLLQFPLWRVVGTDVESLTVRFWISIIALDLQSMEVIGHPSKLSQLGRIEFDYLHFWLNHDCALFRHLGVASESGVWGEGKDRVILCTNKTSKYKVTTGKICSYESVNTTPVQAPLGCCWQELPGGRVGRPGPGSLLPMWTLLQILVAWKDGFFIGLLFGWLIDWRVCWSAALLVGQLV